MNNDAKPPILEYSSLRRGKRNNELGAMQVMAILLLFIIGPTLIVIGFLIGIFAEFRRPIDFLPCAGIAVFGVGLIYVSVKMYRVDRGSED